MYEYTSVNVPKEAADIINKAYDARKPKEPRLRKADLWIEAVRKLEDIEGE